MAPVGTARRLITSLPVRTNYRVKLPASRVSVRHLFETDAAENLEPQHAESAYLRQGESGLGS